MVGTSDAQITIHPRTTLSRLRSYLRKEVVRPVGVDFEFTPEKIENILSGYNDCTKVTIVQERKEYTFTYTGSGFKRRGPIRERIKKIVQKSFEERFVRLDTSSQWTHLGYKPDKDLTTLPPP